MECWKAFTVIELFSLSKLLIIKRSNMKNKVNSLILDYEMVLGLHILEKLHKASVYTSRKSSIQFI